MSFKIESVDKQQNIVDGNISIAIGGINTAKGRNKLKTFLKKVYDTDSNGDLDAKELRRLKDEYGKEITEEKLNTVFKKFFNKEISGDNSSLTPVMKNAIKVINKKLYGKVVYYAVFKKDGKEYVAPQNLSKYIAKCKDPAALEKISLYYKKLHSALIRFASRSDYHAQIILDILSENILNLGFSANDKAMEIMEETDAGAFYDYRNPKKRVVFVPKETFDTHNFFKLEEMLVHETIHALDDIKVDDRREDTLTLSYEGFLVQISRLCRKDFNTINKLIAKIPELKSTIAKCKLLLAEEKIHILSHLDGKDYYVSEKSTRIIKESTWMWTEKTTDEDEYIVSIFNSFTVEYNKYVKGGKIDDDEEKTVLMEYIAVAVQFYLSPDTSKRERLKHYNPELCTFIEKVFLPEILKIRRLK